MHDHNNTKRKLIIQRYKLFNKTKLETKEILQPTPISNKTYHRDAVLILKLKANSILRRNIAPPMPNNNLTNAIEKRLAMSIANRLIMEK